MKLVVVTLSNILKGGAYRVKLLRVIQLSTKVGTQTQIPSQELSWPLLLGWPALNALRMHYPLFTK